MASALAAAGASVTIASPRVAPEGDVLEADVELAKIEQVLPGDYGTSDAIRAAMEWQAAEVAELARELKADAVYERYSLFSNAGILAAAALGIPHALEVNAPLREEAVRFRTLPHRAIAGEIETEVYVATDRLFAVSNKLAELIVAEGVEPSRIEVTPNAVAASKFPPRRRAGRRFTIGFAGSLKPWHGVESLLAAFDRALASGLDLALEIVGEGPLDAALDQADLPEGRVIRRGVLPHAAATRLMSAWDVGVAPYPPLPDFYFSPLKVLEYMAAGACPVASELGDLADLLGDERGMLVGPGDDEQLAAALISLAADRGRTRLLGRRARAYVRANCRWEDNAARVLAALSPNRQAVAA